MLEALGMESGISRSEMSRIRAALDGQVAGFFSRRLDQALFPFKKLGFLRKDGVLAASRLKRALL
jgi:hypothetical protein